uniref:EKC/KEOPS complex subunit CGI121 n=2 Tax=Rhodosorus marinus TaxID=101924 RepID=A0A7S2ZP78_9RHOD|mmetsp:Transcript_24148/g.95114  ORF Transcript_24148/g.95114 Transcript_24148/m.95114 type:complete len:172 (+) Transcript_24148:310-825(+)
MLRRLVDGTAVELMMYNDVKNSLSIKSKLMSGELECAVLDKHLVVDVFQVMVAAQMAYQRYTTGKAACRTMHAEVLYSLSAMKSISNVFATFGLDGNQRELLIVVINPQKTNIEKIQSSIDGKEVSDIERSLRTGYDEARIKEIYKISDTELQVGSILDAALSRMASKSFL